MAGTFFWINSMSLPNLASKKHSNLLTITTQLGLPTMYFMNKTHFRKATNRTRINLISVSSFPQDLMSHDSRNNIKTIRDMCETGYTAKKIHIYGDKKKIEEENFPFILHDKEWVKKGFEKLKDGWEQDTQAWYQNNIQGNNITRTYSSPEAYYITRCMKLKDDSFGSILRCKDQRKVCRKERNNWKDVIRVCLTW